MQPAAFRIGITKGAHWTSLNLIDCGASLPSLSLTARLTSNLNRQRMHPARQFSSEQRVDHPVAGHTGFAVECGGGDPDAVMCLTALACSSVTGMLVRFVDDLKDGGV